MANKRIFWAVHAVGIAPKDSASFTTCHGVQSVGMTTTFNLAQSFELGQLAIYENVEDIPDIEVTLTKDLDGYPLLYHLGTRGYVQNTLVGRSNQRCNIALSIFGDTQNSASGVPLAQVNCSGMYVSNVSYTLPVQGNCSESVTFVGNNKTWRTSGYTFTGTLFDNTDAPLNVGSGYGGIQRRENVNFDVNSTSSPDGTLLPGGTGGIRGISSSGTNDVDSNGQYGAHVQDITVSADFGRDAIFELGRKTPYFRFVNFPVEVTTEIAILATDGDHIGATEAGVVGDGNNLSDKTIYIELDDGTVFNMGSKNKLSNVTYDGGDAGGDNVTCTYRYTTFNDLIVTQDQDPG